MSLQLSTHAPAYVNLTHFTWTCKPQEKWIVLMIVVGGKVFLNQCSHWSLVYEHIYFRTLLSKGTAAFLRGVLGLEIFSVWGNSSNYIYLVWQLMPRALQQLSVSRGFFQVEKTQQPSPVPNVVILLSVSIHYPWGPWWTKEQTCIRGSALKHSEPAW